MKLGEVFLDQSPQYMNNVEQIQLHYIFRFYLKFKQSYYQTLLLNKDKK